MLEQIHLYLIRTLIINKASITAVLQILAEAHQPIKLRQEISMPQKNYQALEIRSLASNNPSPIKITNKQQLIAKTQPQI